MAVAELAQARADAASPEAARALTELADELTTLAHKQASRVALKALAAAFYQGCDRVIRRAKERAA